MPKDKYIYKLGKETFINPYNFVSVNWERKETKGCESIKEEGHLLTGVMNCTIYTKTPLSIPDIERMTLEGEHKRYPFMRNPQDEPMIPGSSLRGVLRSVYETATGSCLSTMKEHTRISIRRTSRGTLAPGLLIKEKDGWKLYKAVRYMLKAKNGSSRDGKNREVWNNTKCPVYEVMEDEDGKFIYCEGRQIYAGDRILFDVLEKDDQKGNDRRVRYLNRTDHSCGMVASKVRPLTQGAQGENGYLVLGEKISNKHHESVFQKGDPVEAEQEMIEQALNGLKETLKVYRDPGINKKYGEKKDHRGYPDYERMENNGVIPVWWEKNEAGLYFSFAAIGRIAFVKELNDLAGAKAPCTSREELCDACRLFGMAQKNGKAIQAVGSRVRITDARCLNFNSGGERMLPELGTPRTSYLPFYVNAENVYEVKGKAYGYDEEGAKLKGRKFYWHSGDVDEKVSKAEKEQGKTKRNATVEVAEKGSRFEFQIYFDGVMREELEKLAWCLNFGENQSDSRLCHKIGHGKPAGLGSVKITVDSIMERKFDKDNGYCTEPVTIDYEKVILGADSEAMEELRKICTFDEKQKTSYPYVLSVRPKEQKGDFSKEKEDENVLANHRWFSENINQGRNNEEIMQILPKISEKQELKIYEVQKKDHQGKHNIKDNRFQNGNRKRY